MIVSLGGISTEGFGPVLGYLFKSSINSGVIAMIGGLIIVPIISTFTKKPPQSVVDEAFSSYERTITVKAKESLGFEEVIKKVKK